MMTHRELCRAAAKWFIDGRGLWAAGWEVGIQAGGQRDAVGVTCPDPVGDLVVRCREYDIADKIRRASYERRLARKRKTPPPPLFDGQRPPPTPYTERRIAAPYRAGTPRIEVAECKVSRADWLADVRTGKLRRYEPGTSHRWLCIPEEMADLGALVADGLPETWGVWVATGRYGTVLRDAPNAEVEPWEVVAMGGIILRSLSWRGLGNGPVAEEMTVAEGGDRRA